MNDYQTYIAVSKYARYIDEKKRRETWPETVERTIQFWVNRYKPDKQLSKVLGKDLFDIRSAILNLEVMPSMRCLSTAGEALNEHNVAGYNCGYTPIDKPTAFSELAYISLCGTGVGFSVESKYVSKLPEIPEKLYGTDTCVVVRDSKLGWAKAIKEFINLLYTGHIPNWDVSLVRPRGTRLVVFGGRASGPDPLVDLFEFLVRIFRQGVGRKLTSLECHDICCKIADIVVVGGVRRSALISLSDPNDQLMQRAKSGRWWEESPYRALSNNSLCYTELPEFRDFLTEWTNLYDSRSGERGIFSRLSASKHIERNVPRRESDWEFGTNPCSEILLRPRQFCNLSEVVCRPGDNYDSLKSKVRLATILGTLQSTLTDFKFLSKEWKTNCEEERLLGVSLTGIMDNTLLCNYGITDVGPTLSLLKEYAIEVNKEYAGYLGIVPSASITCVKPSGTVSQLVDSASGIHPRFSKWYIRRVRNDNKDSLTQFLKEQGVPNEPDVTKPNEITIFSFPEKAPEESITVDRVSAIEQLNLWKIYAENWCEHKPSMTCYYTDKEFLECGDWVFRNLDTISGIAFLPKVDHIYKQAPYEAITEEQYNIMLSTMPKIYWDEFKEEDDSRDSYGELACSSDKCEITL